MVDTLRLIVKRFNDACCDAATCMFKEPENTSRQVLVVRMFKKIHMARIVS